MPVLSRLFRLGQSLSVLLLGALLVACASPVPAPDGVTSGPQPGGVVQRPGPPPAAVTQAPSPAPASVPASADAERLSMPVGAASEVSPPGVASPPPIAQGLASWYGPKFHGRRTASGERYDMHGLTAAHKTLPFGTKVRVRSLYTGKEVVVRINDRGPFSHSRIIDLSLGAISALGLRHRGVTEVVLLRE